MKVLIRYLDGSFFAGWKTYLVGNEQRKSPSFGSFYEAKQMPIEEARATFSKSLVSVEFLQNTAVVGIPKFKVVE